MNGPVPPRRWAVTAAPLAPVPEESVSPTPRSNIRARTRLPLIAMNETLVRLGNSRWDSISAPTAPMSICSSSAPTTIAHWGLPIETCWNSHSRPAAVSVPRPSAPPEGKSLERVVARPIWTEQVRSEVIVGTIGPAAVPIAKVSSALQPWRRR